MIARRCNICLTNWPDLDKYKTCPKPECEGEDTRRCKDARPLDRDEAKSLASRYTFEAFYEEWDEEQPEARLDPDFDPVCRSLTYEAFAASPPAENLASIAEPEEA